MSATALAEEVEARIEAMAATGDVPPKERRRQALEDIADLSAEDHGAYSAREVGAWNRIRRAARAALARKPTIFEALSGRLGRTPTNAELKAEVGRIKTEALVEAATRGKLPHQRKRR